MKSLSYFIQKFSLYVAAMVLALALTYFLGLAPMLKAQTPPAAGAATGPLDPDLPELPAQNTVAPPPGVPPLPPPPTGAPQPVSSGATTVVPSSAAATLRPKTATSPSAVVALPTNKSATTPNSQAVPSVKRPDNSALGNGVLFRHTKSYIGEISNPDRDPFRKPMYILELEEDSSKPQQKVEEARIDDQMEAIRRWPLRDYRLIGVIWDVQSPKAMIVDPTGTMHLLKRNYRIGDKDGIISSISEGTITIIQDSVPVVMAISGK